MKQYIKEHKKRLNDIKGINNYEYKQECKEIRKRIKRMEKHQNEK